MKNKLLIIIPLVVMIFMMAGYGTVASAQSQTPTPMPQAGTPAPGGQITVPAVDMRINSPAMSIPLNLPGPNPLINQPDAQARIASILTGIWHGIISPVTVLVSFINPAIQMVEVHNDGSPYNLGFLLGVALVFMILGVFAGSRRR